jgi:hypothetical protein
MVVSGQLVAAVATAAVPSLAVLIGVLINNQRLNDLSGNMDVRFGIDDSKDILRSEMFRVEQVLDARLKHLEEHLRGN